MAPVPPGPITIDVEVLRDGRTPLQAAADLRVDGKLALRVHGVFGVAHDIEHSLLDVRFPEVPHPEDVTAPEPPPDEERGPWGHINFHDQTDWRPLTSGLITRWITWAMAITRHCWMAALMSGAKKIDSSLQTRRKLSAAVLLRTSTLKFAP